MFTSLVEWSEGKEYSYHYNISWKRMNKDEFITSSVETMGKMDCILNVHHTTSCIFVLGTKVVLGVHEYGTNLKGGKTANRKPSKSMASQNY